MNNEQTINELIQAINTMQSVIVSQAKRIIAVENVVNDLLNTTVTSSPVPVQSLNMAELESFLHDSDLNLNPELPKSKGRSAQSPKIAVPEMDTLSVVVDHIRLRKAAGLVNMNIVNAWRANPQHINEPRIYCDREHNSKCKTYAKLNKIELKDVSALLLSRLGTGWTVGKI